MNKRELEAFERRVLEGLEERKKLGPYDVNAEPILFLYGCVAVIAKHLNKKPARKRASRS